MIFKCFIAVICVYISIEARVIKGFSLGVCRYTAKQLSPPLVRSMPHIGAAIFAAGLSYTPQLAYGGQPL
jgi:hypothetical protein